MKLARILCWLLFPLLIGVVQSCCNCADTLNYRFEIDKAAVQNLDNSGIKPVVTQSDTLGKKSYGMTIALHSIKVAFQKTKISNLFIQDANASDICPCKVPFSGAMTDTLTNIHIYTVHDFDSTHLAGAELTGYFSSEGRNPLAANGQMNQPFSSYDFDPPSIVYNYILMHEPQYSSLCQFKIEIVFSDNRKFELVTNPVTLI